MNQEQRDELFGAVGRMAVIVAGTTVAVFIAFPLVGTFIKWWAWALP